MIVNGFNQYDLAAKLRFTDYQNHTVYYVNGVEYFGTTKKTTYVMNPSDRIDFDQDYFGFEEDGNGSEPPNTFSGILGYGIYKIIIMTMENGSYSVHTDSLLLDQDLSNQQGDHWIHFRDSGNDPRTLFQYQFETELNWIRISSTTYIMEPWNHYFRDRAHGNAFFDFSNGNNVYLFPLDSKRDCNRELPPPFNPTYQDNNQVNGDARVGNLTFNLAINHNVETPIENNVVNTPSFINIMRYTVPDYGIKKCSLTVNAMLNVRYDDWYTPYNNRFTQINNYGVIVIKSGHQINLEKYNKMYLYTGSVLKLEANSELDVFSRALFCNNGGIVQGPGRIRYLGGLSTSCNELDNISYFEDSCQVILQDSSVLEIPNGQTWQFNGNTTQLLAYPNSKIKFGANSKLIFQNGARLIANNAAFISLDSTQVWDGIYLEDNSNDTITNCTIENAANGINIIDKVNSGGLGEQPSVEISNCTFRNTTNLQLTNGIYVNNSYNVLLKNNTFSSTPLISGFATGIMAEYCPSGNFNIIDNTISNSLTGITIIQSSPYIARNTINGLSESGKGIYLDNSNGTIKYNIVNNYVNSLVAYYSSPYLLKNTFTNASERNLDIYTSSVPVMHPVTSGSTLSWLAGNDLPPIL
jgi:hypothetical protein